MPVNHVKEFLKSVHTKAFFPELFSQNFEQLFQNSETFFQKKFLAQIITHGHNFNWFDVLANPTTLKVLY